MACVARIVIARRLRVGRYFRRTSGAFTLPALSEAVGRLIGACDLSIGRRNRQAEPVADLQMRPGPRMQHVMVKPMERAWNDAFLSDVVGGSEGHPCMAVRTVTRCQRTKPRFLHRMNRPGAGQGTRDDDEVTVTKGEKRDRCKVLRQRFDEVEHATLTRNLLRHKRDDGRPVFGSLNVRAHLNAEPQVGLHLGL
jgi:hypothetical protein